MIKLVVALGNPGREYEFTRHNIGWLVLDETKPAKNSIWKDKFKGSYCDFNLEGEKRYFLKPLTYMNLSGESARALMDFFKIGPEEILVVHDELDLDFGKVAFKNGGGLAGHNGLKSLAAQLGTQAFKRLRIGIGRPERGSVSDWVLSGFYDQNDDDLGKVFSYCAEAIESCLEKGFEKTSNKYSNKNILE